MHQFQFMTQFTSPLLIALQHYKLGWGQDSGLFVPKHEFLLLQPFCCPFICVLCRFYVRYCCPYSHHSLFPQFQCIHSSGKQRSSNPDGSSAVLPSKYNVHMFKEYLMFCRSSSYPLILGSTILVCVFLLIFILLPDYYLVFFVIAMFSCHFGCFITFFRTTCLSVGIIFARCQFPGRAVTPSEWDIVS